MWRRSPGRGRRVEPALAPEKGGDPRSGEDRRNPPSPSGRTSFMEDRGFRVREKARFTHVIAFLRSDVRKKRFIAHITTVFTTAAASAVTWTSVMDISSARCIGDSDNITMLLSPEITNFTEI